MAATADVQEANGAGPSYSTVTNCRFKTADNATQDTANPTKILGSINYSYWKHLTLLFGGTFTGIDNIRLYTDGTCAWTFGTAGEVRIGARDSGDYGCPVGSYEQSAGPAAGQGYDLENVTNGHDYYNGQTNKSDSLFTFTSGSTCTIDTGTSYTTGQRCKFAVLQLKVDTNATQGYQTTETITWLYDEV